MAVVLQTAAGRRFFAESRADVSNGGGNGDKGVHSGNGGEGKDGAK
jgi:hypothetical protein